MVVFLNAAKEMIVFHAPFGLLQLELLYFLLGLLLSCSDFRERLITLLQCPLDGHILGFALREFFFHCCQLNIQIVKLGSISCQTLLSGYSVFLGFIETSY